MGDGDSIPGGVRDTLRTLASGVRFGQFVSVGAVGAGVDFLVLALLVEIGGLTAAVAKLGSAEAAIVVMFLVNEHWTFADWGQSGRRHLARRFLTSNFVRAGGAGVAWLVLTALVLWVGVHYLIANALGIGVGFFVNYLLESLLTWQVHAD